VRTLLDFLLGVMLSIGRSDDDRVSMLGDLEEERHARLASGHGGFATSAWYAAEIVRACVWGLRDAVVSSDLRPGLSAMSMFWGPDITLGLRLLLKKPGLTAVSSVGIAVGIAIGAGMFGFLRANFAPTLPLDEGDRIVALENWECMKASRGRCTRSSLPSIRSGGWARCARARNPTARMRSRFDSSGWRCP
jgi:hypothetical protein